MLYPLLLPVLWATTLVQMAVFNEGIFFESDRWAGYIVLYTLFVLMGMIYQVLLYPVWLTLLYFGFRGILRSLRSNEAPNTIRDLVISNIAYTLLFVLPPVLYYHKVIPYVGP